MRQLQFPGGVEGRSNRLGIFDGLLPRQTAAADQERHECFAVDELPGRIADAILNFAAEATHDVWMPKLAQDVHLLDEIRSGVLGGSKRHRE